MSLGGSQAARAWSANEGNSRALTAMQDEIQIVLRFMRRFGIADFRARFWKPAARILLVPLKVVSSLYRVICAPATIPYNILH
jgi:hypothetical protein